MMKEKGVSMNRFMSAVRLAALSVFLMAASAVADYSPEFHQLVAEIKAQVEIAGPGITTERCDSQMFDIAKRGMQDMMATNLLTKVVVEPLETGAKVAAGAVGAPGITTYSLVRCYMKEADLEGFKRCAIGEAIGKAGGEALKKYGGANDLQEALAGAAWDKAYDALRGAVEGYQSKSELLEHDASGECSINVTMRWSKRREPGAEGGKVWVYIRAKDCRCPTGASLKQGWLRFTVPVHYTRAGSSQPGWTAGTPREYLVNATCCRSSGVDERAWIYNSNSKLVGRLGDPEKPAAPPPTITPAPAPPPAPLTPPPAPTQQWSETNPCPECQPFLDLAIKHRNAAEAIAQTIAELRQRLAANQGRQRATQARIDQINKEISGKSGEGGSAYDPDSGLTTESWTQPDGSVKITVRNSQGQVVEERTRKRRDVTALRKRLAQEEAELARLQQEERMLQNEILRQARGRETQLKLEADARAALKQCLAERCRMLAPAPATGACNFQPLKPVTIGPKEKYGDSLAKAASDRAKGMVGGLLGSFLGGSPIQVGTGGGEEPEMVKDPVPKKQKQLFASGDGNTAIKVGAVPDRQGGMRLSIDVDESQEKGVVHTVARETLDAQCKPKREFPAGYWLYEIWQDWKLSVWWSHEHYVDNQLVKRESGSWFKEGSLMLDSGTFDENDIKYTPWGHFGFERPHKGPRSIGATFADWQPHTDGAQAAERIVVHVSEPHLDPVTTTAFELYPVYQAGGEVLFSPTPPVVNSPPLKIGGGMTQIDPPAQPAPKESILDEITDTASEGRNEVIRGPDGSRITHRPDGSKVQAPAADAGGQPAESILDDIEPVTGTQVMPDGTRITTRKDGMAEEVRPDGTRIEFRPDGTRLVKQPNGVWIQYRPDGTWVEYTGSGRITEYRPDGTVILQDPGVGVVEKRADGTATHHRPDGSTVVRYPDGSRVETRADGSRKATFPDGSSIEHDANGRIHIQEAPAGKPPSAGSAAARP